MSRAELAFGILASATVFIGGVWALLRGIFRQVNATEVNTRATEKLTAEVDKLAERITRLEIRTGGGAPAASRARSRRPG